MTIAVQVLTYIKQNTEQADEITLTKEETLNIFTELKLQMDSISEETRIFAD
jgi:hypothetical protein